MDDIYRVSKKLPALSLFSVYIFAKYWPFFKILSPAHSGDNLQ